MSLSAADLVELARIARAAVREHRRTGGALPGRPHKPSLLAHGALEVMATLDGEQRAQAHAPASAARYLAVQTAAIAAASALDPSILDRVEWIVRDADVNEP